MKYSQDAWFDRSSTKFLVEEMTNQREFRPDEKFVIKLYEQWCDCVGSFKASPAFSCAYSVQICPQWFQHVHQSCLQVGWS